MKSTLHALTDRRFLCTACLSAYPHHQNRAKMIERTRGIQGCEVIGKDSIHRIKDESGTIHFSTCVGNFFSPSVMYWIEQFDMFEKGVMLFPGSVGEQPSKLMDVMRIIRGYRLRQRELEQKKRNQQSRSKLGAAKRGR